MPALPPESRCSPGADKLPRAASRSLIQGRARQKRSAGWSASLASRLAEEPACVIPQQLLPRLGAEARPGEDVVDRARELTFRVRVVGGVHQDAVAEKAGHGPEHILAFLVLDRTEIAAALQVFARLHVEFGGRADIGVLLVHAAAPERQPAEAAFQRAEAQIRVAIQRAAADEGGDKAHRAPRVRRQPAE